MTVRCRNAAARLACTHTRLADLRIHARACIRGHNRTIMIMSASRAWWNGVGRTSTAHNARTLHQAQDPESAQPVSPTPRPHRDTTRSDRHDDDVASAHREAWQSARNPTGWLADHQLCGIGAAMTTPLRVRLGVLLPSAGARAADVSEAAEAPSNGTVLLDNTRGRWPLDRATHRATMHAATPVSAGAGPCRTLETYRSRSQRQRAWRRPPLLSSSFPVSVPPAWVSKHLQRGKRLTERCTLVAPAVSRPIRACPPVDKQKARAPRAPRLPQAP